MGSCAVPGSFGRVGTQFLVERRRGALDRIDGGAIERIASLDEERRHIARQGRNKGRMQLLRFGGHAAQDMHSRCRWWYSIGLVNHTSRGLSMKKLILLVAGVALLSVACKAEVNVLVDINDDQSGTVAFEFASTTNSEASSRRPGEPPTISLASWISKSLRKAALPRSGPRAT